MFVQRLNAATGELEWCAGDDGNAAADAVASSSYLDMLNDAPRNAAFAAALAVAAPGRRVLDIGTGTGLLALLASAAGAACVTACDVFPPMAACAAANAQRNGCGERVRVALKRSDELQVGAGAGADMGERAEVLVFEVLDSELLGEGVLPTLRDAKARLLTPGAAVIPARATVHAALVDCDALRRCHARPPLAGGADAEPHCSAEAASARGVATLAPMHALHLTPFANEARFLVTRPAVYAPF
jgi:protein arginine N-methyltransferase 7